MNTQLELELKQQRQEIYRKIFDNIPLTLSEQAILENSYYWNNQSKPKDCQIH